MTLHPCFQPASPQLPIPTPLQNNNNNNIHSTQRRFVTGPLNVLFSGVYVSTFQPGSFTGWVVKGLNVEKRVYNIKLEGKGSVRAAIFIRCLGCLNAEKRVYNIKLEGKGSIRAAIFIRCLGWLNAEKRVYNIKLEGKGNIRAAIFIRCLGCLKGPWTLILSRKYHLLCTI